MNKNILIILLLVVSTGFGQEMFNIGTAKPLMETYYNEYCLNPVYSPNGQNVAFSNENYNTLLVYNLTKHTIVEISREASAGFGFKWSPDSKYIATRISKFSNGKRQNALKVFSLSEKEENVLVPLTTGFISTPQWSGNGTQIYYTTTKGLNINNLNNSSINKKPQDLFYINKNKVYMYETVQKSKKTLYSSKLGEIIEANLSPDSSKIAIESIDGNIYVINSDGSNLVSLGVGDCPDWSPDSKYIIYSITEDDGHVFTKSNLYVASSDGIYKQKITNSDMLEMNPDWSPDGKSIIFNDYENGMLYIISIEKNN